MTRRGRTLAGLKLAGFAAAGVAVALAIVVWPFLGPATIVRGVANEIAIQSVKGGTNFRIELADGQHYVWSCRSRSCRQTERTLVSHDVQWAMPMAVVVTLYSERVTGLDLGVSRLIVPEAEITRQEGETFGLVFGLGGFVLAVAIANSAWMGRHRRRRRRAALQGAKA